MNLNLHSGGEEIPYEMLRQLPVPEATKSHHPVPHYRLVQAVKNTLQNYGHEVVEEHHAIDKGGDRYFGLLSLRSEYGDYEDVLGLRNSSDKSFPIGIAFGGRVHVCSNLSFSGDIVIRRKHTVNAWRDVHGLLAEIIEPLALQREAQARTIERFKFTALSDMMADHALMQLYRRDVLNIQRIPEVLQQWDTPSHDWGERTAWRLFNSVTFSLSGKIVETPKLTTQLYEVIEGVCSTVH